MGYIPYVVFLLIIVFFVVLESFASIKPGIKKAGFFIILILFFLILSFKSSSVGQDSASYEKIYNVAKTYSLLDFLKLKRGDYGFYGLLYFFSKVLNAPSFIFWSLNYFIITICLFLSFYKSKKPVLFLSIFLLIGFLRMCFSGLRQSVAVSICTLAIICLFNYKEKHLSRFKSYIIFFTLIFISSLFHISSLLLMLIPIFLSIKINKKYMWIPLIFIPFISEIGGGLFTFLTSMFSFAGFYQPISGRPSLLLLMFLLIFFVYYLLCNDTGVSALLSEKTSFKGIFTKTSLFNNCVILFYFFCFFLACNTFNGTLCRFSMYFYVFIPFMFYSIIYAFENKKTKIALTSILLTMLSVYFIYEGLSLKLFPYDFIW